jgi:hypothetical protein
VFDMWSYKHSGRRESFAVQDDAEFSIARYEPMGRLLCNEDLEFLQAQPGYTKEIGREFSRERRRIFRRYLRELAGDFHRLHAHARVAVAGLSAEDSPLVGMLLRQQMRFWYEMAAVELRLSLSWAGMGSLDARGLIEALATMQAEIGRLAAPSMA